MPARKTATRTAAHRNGSLHERIWGAVRRIPAGRVATYGQIARLLGLGRSARLVGYALHSLPPGMPVPWHRVINARGSISFPPGSPLFSRQRELLAREGIPLAQGRVDLSRFGWKPRQRTRGQSRVRQRR